VLRETDPQTTLWELLLAEEAKGLPAELARVDAYLDDECFIAPWRALFDQRLGRPSVPIDPLLRLLYLKHRYGLGYERLGREVADSISWRRCCRIGLDRPVPHPTTLVKLVGRAGPETIEQLNPPWWPGSPRASCWGPASCGWRPRWWRPTSTIGPMPTCWRVRSASWVGWSGGSRVVARPARPRSAIVAGRPVGGCRQLARPLRRRSGVAMAEVDRRTGEVAQIARHTLGEGQGWRPTPAGRGGIDPAMGGWDGWWVTWPRRSPRPSGCWPRPTSGWPATG
jgi:transposase, IS5 family